jgi:hypothetical protein
MSQNRLQISGGFEFFYGNNPQTATIKQLNTQKQLHILHQFNSSISLMLVHLMDL